MEISVARKIQKKGQITIVNIKNDSQTYWGYDEFRSHKTSGKTSIMKLGFLTIKILTINLVTKQTSNIQIPHMIPCKSGDISTFSKICQPCCSQVTTAHFFWIG